MRKIVAGLFVSLDGVYQAPETWHLSYFNDEMGEIVGGQMEGVDAILLGRVTYEEFEPFWPTSNEEISPFMNETPKYVVTSSLDKLGWQNSTALSGDVVAEVGALKQQPGGDILVMGSGELVRALLAADLLDELQLLVHPVVVGGGKRLFPEGAARTPLDLLGARPLSTGVLHLTYRTATEPAAAEQAGQ
jgi:dihydrofolate reductase